MGLKHSYLALRVILATLVAASPVQAQPVVELLTRYAVPADETAASAPEGDAPQGSGKKLAELEADLALVSEGLEAFAHPQDAAKALLSAKPRLPAGTSRFFRDRATALDSLYRTLAVVDYTWALRFPNPPCSPAEKRGELLRSDDGLFVDRVSGQTSAWMSALLGPVAKGKNLEAALDRASASVTPSQAEYARLRARQNLITKALGSEDAVGAARAGLYCKRAETRVKLAAANRASKQVLAARSSEAKAPRQGLVIVAGKTSEGLEARGAGVVVNTKAGVRVLTDRRLGDGEVVALVDGVNAPVPLTIEREDAPSGLLLLRPSGNVGEALTLAETAPEKDDLVFAYAHSERLGAWTRTQGLVTSAGSNQFQTDAIVDASMTGGAVLDEEGRLAGLLVLRSAAAGEWPAGVPGPALNSWIDGGGAPDAEPGLSLDAGTTKILTASRPLLDSLSVGQDAITAARVADIYTPTPWGTVRGVCVANCEDSAPATSYSGGSNGNRELGEALGKLAAVGLEALIFKGIPALFRGIGSLFKSKPRASQIATKEKKAEVKKEVLPDPKLALVLSPAEAALLPGKTVTFTAKVSANRKDLKLDGHLVEFSITDGVNVSTSSAVTDAAGIARLTVSVAAPAIAHRDLDEESAKHPWLTNASRGLAARSSCHITVMAVTGTLAVGATIAAPHLALAGASTVVAAAPLSAGACMVISAAWVASAKLACDQILGKEVVDVRTQPQNAPVPPSREVPTAATPPLKVYAASEKSHGDLDDYERAVSAEMAGGQSPDPNEPPEDGEDPDDPERVVEISQDQLEHIVKRHWPKSGSPGAGKFGEGTRGRELLKMIRETAKHGKISPNTQGRPGKIFEHTFNDVIGRNSHGALTRRIRMVVAPDGTVITAFPF